jgi:predicted NAD-dependent protein-ADP-ribosyltransferase YbiA (DUF1768 family)
MKDKLRFFSRSRDVAPGKGAGEEVRNPSDYALLASIPHWRRVLSNFHVAPFLFEGLRYRTIEHAFQASKIARVDREKAFAFSMDSGSPLGLDGDGLEARKHRKWALLDGRRLAEWNEHSASVMEAIAREKFLQSPEAMTVLMRTGNAQLWHIMPRAAPVRFAHLERIRDG